MISNSANLAEKFLEYLLMREKDNRLYILTNYSRFVSSLFAALFKITEVSTFGKLLVSIELGNDRRYASVER